MNRFFTDKTLTMDSTVTLPDDIAAHAVRVLRLKTGDSIELVDASQTLFLATIMTQAPLTVELTALNQPQVELPVDVTIACGIPKGDKAELIVQKATELGVSQVVFFNSRWATAKWPKERQEKKVKRLQTIAQNAAEQSHRMKVPQVTVQSLDAIATLTADARLVAYEEAAKIGESSALVSSMQNHPKSLVVVFGPEGGLHQEEVESLEKKGFVRAGLGPRILRTETAPLYLLSAVSTLTELQGEKR